MQHQGWPWEDERKKKRLFGSPIQQKRNVKKRKPVSSFNDLQYAKLLFSCAFTGVIMELLPWGLSSRASGFLWSPHTPISWKDIHAGLPECDGGMWDYSMGRDESYSPLLESHYLDNSERDRRYNKTCVYSHNVNDIWHPGHSFQKLPYMWLHRRGAL